MTQEEVFGKVKDILVDQFDLDDGEVTMTTNMTDDIDADSLDLFEVLNRVEDDFDVKLEAADDVQTVADLVNKIQAELDKK
ncbi:acyl carrier protein [Leuconostocaceae bacterium ESL0958]|nr:acyl carrier protein [Leuconostocaceae bacterium ESL0958]